MDFQATARHIFELKGFLFFVQKVDRARTVTGAELA